MKITDFLQQNIVYLDGGMGTLLQAQGLLPGELPERWNISHPEVITKIHRDYFDAGSNIVSTNTFGANLLKFSHDELCSIIEAAVKNARRAAEESEGTQKKWVALDIGPSGRMLAPYGDFDFEDAVSLFAETVKIGASCGVDLIFIETMNDSYETKAALLAAKENCDLPVFVSNAYNADGKLMTGASPEAMVAMLEGMGADAIGVNCSLGPKALAPIVDAYLACASVPVLVKPNAGLPKAENGKTVYDVLPAEFSTDLSLMIMKGIRICGGCCGTTPAYIRALTEKTSVLAPKMIQEKNITCVSSYTHSVVFDKTPVLIGERINPTGKKRFKEALKNNDIGYILKEGISQQEKGVHILDVNVGLPEIDEVSMLKETVCRLQAVVNLPLQIDTSDPVAMEAALRRYNGKAMINSVNGKEESMAAVFPLVKKYGGVVVALTLDERGIPKTANERVEIAEKIILRAAQYGISRKNIVFDPLALTVSADETAGRETLKAVKMIKTLLDCHTSLGVSNVSFGLPRREVINSTFFAMALSNGLSAAIMNPDSDEMLKTYYAFLALSGQDAACAQYIAFAQTLPEGGQASIAPPAKKTEAEFASLLQKAIVKGLKEEAASLSKECLTTMAPLDIIENEVIPALDIVGCGYENKTVYLPQLLMSAEAAKAAFEVIKENMSGNGSPEKCPFVIATVEGDIHDIGKNIVKLLLENYGFAVTDLGRDVTPETVLAAVKEKNAPMVGLSALMTTTVPAMEKTVALIKKEVPNCKILVGGAVLNAEYAKNIGADYYAKDGMEAVRIAEEIFKNL